MEEASEPLRADPQRDPTPPLVEASNGSTYAAALGALRIARRVAVGVIGSTVVAVGIAMLVLPGPGLVVIPAGLGILGLEFAFARRWLVRLREHAADVAAKVSASVTSTPDVGDDDAKDGKDEEDVKR
jgi:tellurite resistance protein TerC